MTMKYLDSNKLVELVEEGADFIPLMSEEDEELMNLEEYPEVLPILPLRNTVLFPGVVLPITVGRDKSLKLVKDAYAGKRLLGAVSQIDQANEDPNPDELNKVGTVARILKLLKMPDGTITIIIQGKRRFEIEEVVSEEPFMTAKIKSLVDEKGVSDDRFSALIESIKEMATKIIHASPEIPSEASVAVKNIDSPIFLINFISSNLNVDLKQKQEILEAQQITERANIVLLNMTKELQMLEVKNDIQSKVKTDLDKQQREYFLHQQMKTIQEELGGDPQDQEVEELRVKAKAKKWNTKTKDYFNKELAKLQRMNPAGMEYNVQLNYLEVLVELPWNEYTKDDFDLKKAQAVLDRDHFGLKKVKERILEHLAVLKLKGDMKSPILCLAGPPGVGKTSLGKSVAEALGRKYVRASLGGLRDEAEIRGHRKTYIGAMPGRIIQSLKRAETSNPVFILDEIDKVGASFQGDPSSALLEVLDPEQNEAFYDNFVELDYDLSKVLFVATANDLGNIHPALRDRMEIINIPGYTVEEKIEIARKHLLPKQILEHGLKKRSVVLSKKILEFVIESYTREAGVRGLEKAVAKIVRKIALKTVMEEEYESKISLEQISEFLGAGHEKDKYEGNEVAGVVTGLAWTPVGGDILYIESALSPGKGRLTLTGSLGDVMKESAVLALEYLKSHADHFGLKPELFEKYNIHIHVPEGATPKDGPSAGVTMLTSLASLFTQRKVKSKLAMTGEVTLRGKVLPVGGIKEKILAAKRANISEIVMSKANEKDLKEIEENYLKGLNFVFVNEMKEVVDYALTKQKVKEALRL